MLALTHPLIAAIAERLASHQPREAAPWPEARLAAVAAVIRVRDEPELLFIKRADVTGDPWSGHIAFPGGRMEVSDASLEATAVRETFEELAIDLHDGRILGRLDDIAPRSRALPPVIVRPFVALVHPDVQCVPSREVAAAFWVPIAFLQQADARVEHVVQVQGAAARFPAYRIEEHVVWGLTERIVRQLLSLVQR